MKITINPKTITNKKYVYTHHTNTRARALTHTHTHTNKEDYAITFA